MDEPYKSILPAPLKAQRSELAAIIDHLDYALGESSKLSHIAEYELGLAVKRLRNRLNQIDAELNLRRARGIGTAPLVLPDVHDAPSAIAS